MPCQQDVLYTAENRIHQGEIFASLDDVQKFVNELRETDWWERYIGDILLYVEVGRSRSKRSSVGWYEQDKSAGAVEFNTDTPELQLVIHELAHVVAAARRRSKSHDPWFTRVYLELTFLIRGSLVYIDLFDAFTLDGIDFNAGGLV